VFDAIASKQLPDHEKQEKANYVIVNNNGDMSVEYKKVIELIQAYQ
jgi:dephospho-CoA kinase